MTNVRYDNIFEAMRLVLPEHRARMGQYEREQEANQRKKPVVSQERYAEFSLVIAEAVMEKAKIRITLFNKYGDECINGIPMMDRGRLRLATDEGVMEIPVKRVINVGHL
jgi:hypothetical protein